MVRNKAYPQQSLVSMPNLKSEGTNGKLVAHARSPTHSNDVLNGIGSGERGPSEAAIDPLSQVCTNRALQGTP
jgi:hypothetical protein